MKKIYKTLLSAAFCISSQMVFSQTVPISKDSLTKILTGEWKPLKACGGIRGTCDTPYFNTSIIFEKIKDSSVNWQQSSMGSSFYWYIKTGVYKSSAAIKIDTIGLPKYEFPVELKKPFLSEYIEIISKDTIWIGSDVADGMSVQYVKTSSVLTGNKEVKSLSNLIDIFPNPFSNTLQIENANGSFLQLFDSKGQTMTDQLTPEKLNNHDFSNLPAGIYFAEIVIENQTIKKKLMKK